MKKIGIVATIMALLLLVSTAFATVTVTSVFPLVATEDTAYTGGVFAISDNAPITGYTLTGPAWLTIDSIGALTGTPAQADVGANVFTAHVTDADGTTDYAFTITVSDDNADAVTCTSIPDFKWLEDDSQGIEIDLDNYCTDPDVPQTTNVWSCEVQGSSPEITATQDGTDGSIWTFVADDDDFTGSEGVICSVDSDSELVTNSVATNEFELIIIPEDVACEDGIDQNGDLVRINDIDMDPNDIELGEDKEVDFEIEVENRDDDELDVKVEVFLYDVTKGKVIESVESDSEEIDENDDLTFDLSMDVDEDYKYKDSSKYVIYVKAYEKGDEEDQCYLKSEEIDIERQKHATIVKEVDVKPETANPGETVSVEVDVQNIGTKDEDEVTVRLLSTELELDTTSSEFELEEWDDDDSAIKRFTFRIPTDTPTGTYQIEAIVEYNDGDVDSDFGTLKVIGEADEEDYDDSSSDSGSDEAAADLKVNEIEKVKGEYSIRATVTNTGNEDGVFTVKVMNVVGWAEASAPYSEMLEVGQSTTFYVYLSPDEDKGGKRTATVEVFFDSQNLISKALNIDLDEGKAVDENEETEESDDEITGSVTSGDNGIKRFFSGSTLWIIGDIILIVIAIFFIKMLFSKKE